MLGGARVPNQQSRQTRQRMDCWNPTNLVDSIGNPGPALGCPLTIHLTSARNSVRRWTWVHVASSVLGQVTNLADLNVCSLCRVGVGLAPVCEQNSMKALKS